jgi:hypothetical protein
MITVLQTGTYHLIETKNHVKILNLDGELYAWVAVKGISEILVTSHSPHQTDHILAAGVYRLYQVEDEPGLSDHRHLELNVGYSLWQGYLLPTGLPKDKKTPGRLIPTKETISLRHARAG